MTETRELEMNVQHNVGMNHDRTLYLPAYFKNDEARIRMCVEWLAQHPGDWQARKITGHKTGLKVTYLCDQPDKRQLSVSELSEAECEVLDRAVSESRRAHFGG